MPTVLPSPIQIKRKNVKEWEAALKYFFQQLKSNDTDKKIKAIINLEEMGDLRALESLENAMKDDNRRVRLFAKNAINKIRMKNRG